MAQNFSIDNFNDEQLQVISGTGEDSDDRRFAQGTWKHAAFHVSTTIATPAAYAPLPFAASSLGWPLGE